MSFIRTRQVQMKKLEAFKALIIHPPSLPKQVFIDIAKGNYIPNPSPMSLSKFFDDVSTAHGVPCDPVAALAERGLVVINSALASEFLLMKAILVVWHMDCGFVTFFDCSFVYRSAAGLFGKRKSVRGRQDMGNL